MWFASRTAKAINNLVQSSLEGGNAFLKLEWISFKEITNVNPTQIGNVYCAIRKRKYDETITLVLLGSSEECTPTFVSEFARIYSLPTRKYDDNDNNFKRYSKWLNYRNQLIFGVTKSNDDNYYMVAGKLFYHYYSRYGFCSTCGILRCSPVWCICGYKQLSVGWTSKNHQLDDFIKKSQLQTNSPNDAYLEWIPDDCVTYGYLNGLPLSYSLVKLIPLEITDETHDLYYAELCDKHPDILNTDIWVTIGFTYDEDKQMYCLIKGENGLCLACTSQLIPEINAFCYCCKASRPLNWTTGNKSLDSFIMESWRNIENVFDAYIQWIEYSLLTNVQEMTSLRYSCTHIADWLEPTTNELTRITLKKITNKQNNQSFDFHQVTKEFPQMLTPENIWIIGITQEPSTREYYLVFYHEIRLILDKIINYYSSYYILSYMQYNDFYNLKEIGSDSYRTVYTARYKYQETVVLKRFKSFDGTPELFISELRNHAKCANYDDRSFFQIHGVTQDPETKEHMVVMQYANHGSLLSYLDQNINRLTWKNKLECLWEIAWHLRTIHEVGLVHCNLNGGNIWMHDDTRAIRPMICDLGHSRSTNLHQQKSNIRNVSPFIAPEVFHTRKFTQQSDVYSFGVIMYMIATGEQPFRDRQFDNDLIRDIMGGLRPSMPDSAPKKYKKLAEWCCDFDPDKRPDSYELAIYIYKLIDSIRWRRAWKVVYHQRNAAVTASR